MTLDTLQGLLAVAEIFCAATILLCIGYLAGFITALWKAKKLKVTE